MKKDNDDAKNKHARLSEKHAKAVVLREKWLEENEGKTRENWNPKQDMKVLLSAAHTIQSMYRTTLRQTFLNFGAVA